MVTALEFRMYAIETAYAGFLLWDIADAEPVLRELGRVGARRARTRSPRRSG